MQGLGGGRRPFPQIPLRVAPSPLPGLGSMNMYTPCETLPHSLQGSSERSAFGSVKVSATCRLAL